MKALQKSALALALGALTTTAAINTHAVEYGFTGELAVELTSEDDSDLALDVTTTDLVLEVSETFGEITVEGYSAWTKDDSSSTLVEDGAGITVSGAFGSVFIGDDGTGVKVSEFTDVMYNNSDLWFTDNSTYVIDYSLPFEAFSLNLFVDITDQDDEESDDIDMYGIYGSYTIAGITVLAGYSESGEDGAYGEDDVLDLGIGYEGGPVAAGIGYQDVDSLDDETISAFAIRYRSDDCDCLL